MTTDANRSATAETTKSPRRRKTTTDHQPPHPLVGRFFHTTTVCPHGSRVAQWQGQIIAAVTADILLIELFEWFLGQPNGQELITLTDFMARNPVLYSDAEEMGFSYEHGAMGHHCTARTDDDTAQS